jgi:hypothetical protein
MSEKMRPNAVAGPTEDELSQGLGLGSPERPWIVTSAEKAEGLPDGAWFAIAPDGTSKGALVFQKTPDGPVRRT